MEKQEIALFVLVDIYRSEPEKAETIAKKIAEKLGYKKLIGFLKSDNFAIRNMVSKLLMKYFPEKLDYKTLMESLKSHSQNIHHTARELLMKHFPEKLDYEKEAEKFIKEWFE